MQRHYWTIRPNLNREGPPTAPGYYPHPTKVKWETYTDTCLLLEVKLFPVLYRTVLCSYETVACCHGYNTKAGFTKTI